MKKLFLTLTVFALVAMASCTSNQNQPEEVICSFPENDTTAVVDSTNVKGDKNPAEVKDTTKVEDNTKAEDKKEDTKK